MTGKNIIMFAIAMGIAIASCNDSAKENATEEIINYPPPLTEKQVDSVLEKGIIPARTNTRGTMNKKQWVSTSFGINTYTINGKKVYAILLSNSTSKIAINYSGPEKKGTTPTGDLLQASVLDELNVPHPCHSGQISFTQFDTIAKKVSGTFSFNCAQAQDKSKTIDLTDVAFAGLTWK